MIIQKILPFGLVILLGIVLGWWLLWPRTTGTITLVSPDGSTRSEQLETCSAGFGSRLIMFGIHLKTTQGTDVFFPDAKLIPNVAMPIELIRDQKTITSIDSKACSTFQSTLSWGEGNMYTDIRNHVSGNVSAQCSLPDGTKLTLEASVRRCKLR